MVRHNRADLEASGTEDARLDADMMANCPPSEPQGPSPELAWSFFYQEAYREGMEGASYHVCGPGCPSWDREHAGKGTK